MDAVFCTSAGASAAGSTQIGGCRTVGERAKGVGNGPPAYLLRRRPLLQASITSLLSAAAFHQGIKPASPELVGPLSHPPYQVLLKSCPCKPKADISLLPPPIPLATRTPSGLFPLPPQRSPRSETPVWTARERSPAPATRIRTAPSQFAARLNRTSGRSTTYALPVLTSIHCSSPPPL